MLTPLILNSLILAGHHRQFPIPSYEAPQIPTSTKVLVRVNGTPITAGEVARYLWDWKADEILETFTSFEIVDQEAKRLHITATSSEVRKNLDDQLSAFKSRLPAGANLADELRKRGYPMSRVFLTVRSTTLLDKIVLTNFRASDFVRVSTIIVPVKSEVATDVSAAALKAQGYFDQLTKGEDWAKVLATSTTDANVVANKGLLGWRSLDAFPPTAQAELRMLKPGGFTKPVQTQVGIQIFRLENGGASATPDEVKDLKAQYLGAKRPTVLKQLHDRAKIVKP